MYQIQFTEAAVDDLRLLRKYDQQRLLSESSYISRMRTISVPAEQEGVAELCEQARDEDLLVCLADGSEFLLAAIDEFDVEVAQTRRNEKLMALLDERARQAGSVPIDEVRQRLGL